jgi:hypothetical protein
MDQGGHPLSTVYSFVPIPGAQQHKRPRRRYEEIERMYKCGWNGCEKAYGTLNHLNAHVTMQSHGVKRTPEGKSHCKLHMQQVSGSKERCILARDTVQVFARPDPWSRALVTTRQIHVRSSVLHTLTYHNGGNLYA